MIREVKTCGLVSKKRKEKKDLWAKGPNMRSRDIDDEWARDTFCDWPNQNMLSEKLPIAKQHKTLLQASVLAPTSFLINHIILSLQ